MANGNNSRDRKLFPVLTDYQLECVKEVGEKQQFKGGEIIFSEGEDLSAFFVVLEGSIQVTKKMGSSEIVITTHEPGEFTGELSLLTDNKGIATGRAVGDTSVIAVSQDVFRKLLMACPEIAQVILPAMAYRNQEVSGLIQQREKLASLGKLAAGLAHEMNNPAAAAARAVGELRSTLNDLVKQSIQIQKTGLAESGSACLRGHVEHAREQIQHREERDPVALSDAEDAIADWLESHGFENGWELAPNLVRAGYDSEQLEDLYEGIPKEVAQPALRWVSANVGLDLLVRDLEKSLERISTLVKAVKSYSYMDQAPYQEIDIHMGIEDTLTMLTHKLRNVEVVKNFDKEAPKISAFVGELNQVWTNLIVNAVEAMKGQGKLTIETKHDGDFLEVRIGDTGPGIPEEAQPKLFEAFFTTKAPGEGTGLGLEIVYRIVVVRHGGDVSFETSPNGTTFIVCLPIEQQKVEEVSTDGQPEMRAS